jgi:hypothetical protein
MFNDESHYELNTSGGWSAEDLWDLTDSFLNSQASCQGHGLGCLSWKDWGLIEFVEKGNMMNGQHDRKILGEKLEFFCRCMEPCTFSRMEPPETDPGSSWHDSGNGPTSVLLTCLGTALIWISLKMCGPGWRISSRKSRSPPSLSSRWRFSSCGP